MTQCTYSHGRHLSGKALALLVACIVAGALTASAPIALAQGGSQETVRHTIESLYAQQSQVKSVSGVALSPDGLEVAWSGSEGEGGEERIHVAPVHEPGKSARLTSIRAAASPCHETAPQFAPGGHRLAFLSDCVTAGQRQLFLAELRAGAPTEVNQLTQLSGYVSHPQWSPDGKQVALLYVEKASRVPSPMAAERRAVGVIDDLESSEVQRLAVVDLPGAQTRMVTPAGHYIFEYSWSPDSRTFAYSAAPPPGDDNWYIARLYTQPVSRPEPTLIYQPKFQIALPRWSPDGKFIGFITGLMSDEGATGGEIYVVPAQGGQARNLTPNRNSSPSWFSWLQDNELLFTEFAGGSTSIATLNLQDGKTSPLWQGGETIQAGPETTSLALAAGPQGSTAPLQTALVRYSWSSLPEVWAGSTGKWTQMTHLNEDVRLPLPKAESLSWTSTSHDGLVTDPLHVQGWLLFPHDYDPAKKYPLLVAVHGGPAWIAQPTWRASDFDTTLFTNLGYFVLYPNDRGSYGQGERFTQANRRDWGHGDLDDMLAGVEEVVKRYPVDGDRVGILGWSYGGSTAMMAATRSHRFRAIVAGAGASNMQSYYGQNSIDKWMIPYLGASAYDDPAAYARVSAITYVKNARTPTLIVVGERDGEAPPAQSFEFWHALKELGVTTQLVVYADEGHGFSKEEDRIDIVMRTYGWFEQYMGAK